MNWFPVISMTIGRVHLRIGCRPHTWHWRTWKGETGFGIDFGPLTVHWGRNPFFIAYNPELGATLSIWGGTSNG